MSNDKTQKILIYTALLLVSIICIEIVILLIWKFDIVQLAKDNGMDILAFLGAIIGGLITYIGVKTTLKHEQNIRKQDKNQNNIKLLTDVLNELRDDIRAIELTKWEIDKSYDMYLSMCSLGDTVKKFLENTKDMDKETLEKILLLSSLDVSIKPTKIIIEDEEIDKEILAFKLVKNKTNNFSEKIEKYLDEKIIYFDWKVYENIESYNKKLYKLNADEMLQGAKTKKDFIDERLKLCISIINELKNYQAYLREQMRKK